jgi:AraC-like DNA-binding protein
MASVQRDEILGWSTHHGLAEHHAYAPGPAGRLEPHAHDTFQICFSFNLDGVYAYRGREHHVPIGALSVIAPLELHHAWDPSDRAHASFFLTLYPKVDHVEASLARLGLRHAPGAALAGLRDDPVVCHPALGDAMRACTLAGLRSEPAIVQQHVFDTLLARLRSARGDEGGTHVSRVRARIGKARDAIVQQPASDWTIERLARIAHHAPAHFAHAFMRDVGLPPHRFVMQQRIERARRMLCEGASVTETARRCGFADQSHLSKWFARFVQTTPGQYASQKRKNILIERFAGLEKDNNAATRRMEER